MPEESCRRYPQRGRRALFAFDEVDDHRCIGIAGLGPEIGTELAAAALDPQGRGVAPSGVLEIEAADGRLFVPWAIDPLPPESVGRDPLTLAAAYLLLAGIFLAWSVWNPRSPMPPPAERGH